MSEFDPSRAAARAVGDLADDDGADDVDDVDAEASATAGDQEASAGDDQAAGADDGGSSSADSLRGVVRDMLTSTSPNPPLEDVESPWNPEQGGAARIHRGVMKALGVDDLPAWADVLIGVLESSDRAGSASSGSSSSDEDGGGDRDDDAGDAVESEEGNPPEVPGVEGV